MRKLLGKKTRFDGSAASKQRGVVLPIVVIGLLALLAVAGLALDGSHALGNKTRMQNAVDAAALAAAKVLDDTDGDTVLATAAANSLFSINAGSPGNHEMNDAYGAGDISVEVQYSLTLNPSFVPDSFVHGSMPLNNEWWVRVIATGFDTQTTLSKVLGIDEISTPATAVAGPSGSLAEGTGARICNIAPIAVCEDQVPDEADEDVLRTLIPKPGDHDAIGPGNYKLLSMYDDDGKCLADEGGGGKGGDCLRKNLAGSSDTCIDPNGQIEVMSDEESKPGGVIGPVSDGFNTRFNQFQGTGGLNPDHYPPDQYIGEQDIDIPGQVLKACSEPDNPLDEHIFLTVSPKSQFCKNFGANPGFDANDSSTWGGNKWGSDWTADYVYSATQIDYDYERYTSALDDSPSPAHPDDPASGEPGRRLLQFPIVPCDGMKAGRTMLDVMGVACFFMLQSLAGDAANGDNQIFGQYIHKCPANGDSGSETGGGSSGPLLYKIQLYKDPDSKDS